MLRCLHTMQVATGNEAESDSSGNEEEWLELHEVKVVWREWQR
jgi:hypothetical protein